MPQVKTRKRTFTLKKASKLQEGDMIYNRRDKTTTYIGKVLELERTEDMSTTKVLLSTGPEGWLTEEYPSRKILLVLGYKS